MSNSSLVSYVKISPHTYGKRKGTIQRISPHCVVGQCTVETLGNVFSGTRQCSSNYGIGKDGRIAMYLGEDYVAETTSSYANDNLAVTIECASDMTAPYAFNAIVYKQLIELCADICRRNGKKKLLWFANKNTALSYKPSSDEMVLTVHRWFSSKKSCPGDWLMARMSDLAKQVNAKLSSSSSSVSSSSGTEMTKNGTVKATGVARAYKKSIAGTYVTTDELNVRNDAGVKNSIIGVLPKGTKCHCYGYYSNSGLTKWYYIVATVGTAQYIGFVSSAYLRRA